MKERIQKIIAARGVTSRRGAEELITQGRVTCNGAVCRLGDTADGDMDSICIDGKPLAREGKRLYIMLNKPKGYVTTLSDEKGRRNAAQLVSDCGARVYPVGRLDMDSEGLLLFTNDGDFANRLMHPRHQVDKVYQTHVKGFSPEAVSRLQRPMVLDGYRVCAPGVQVINVQGDTAQLQITIHEGRNRQVRRMCARAGMTVKRLVRIREGTLELGDLAPGKWRHLTEKEITALTASFRG